MAYTTKNKSPEKKESAVDNSAAIEKKQGSLTPEERALADRIASDDREWETIREDELEDFSLREDPYKLPKEAVEREQKREFKFRWVEKRPERIDQIRSLDPPARWWLCNATNTPFLKHLCDPVHGGIQKLDQILVFKPYWMFEKHQNAKMQIAENKLNAGDVSKRDGEQKDWGEYRAGPEYRITGKDEVMADYADVEEAVNE